MNNVSQKIFVTHERAKINSTLISVEGDESSALVDSPPGDLEESKASLPVDSSQPEDSSDLSLMEPSSLLGKRDPVLNRNKLRRKSIYTISEMS